MKTSRVLLPGVFLTPLFIQIVANSQSSWPSAPLEPAGCSLWAATGSLNAARDSHTATLLPNGIILAAGGFGVSAVLASAELYDPASGTWMPTGSLNTARSQHTATLLPNGMVLVAGGFDNNINVSASAELYDPASGTWMPTGSLNTARTSHTATLLPKGDGACCRGIWGERRTRERGIVRPGKRDLG